MNELTGNMQRVRRLLGRMVLWIRRLKHLNEDARRYRFMRRSAIFQDRNGPGLYWHLPRTDWNLPLGDRLDKAIDDQLK